MMAMRANIVGAPDDATRIKASIAACHSWASCSAFGHFTISPSVFDFMIAIVPLRKPGNVLTQQTNEFVRRTPIDPEAVLLLESIIRLAVCTENLIRVDDV